MVSLALIAKLALAAFAAGLVDAIAGGGGLVTVPALLAAGLPPPIALATNKGQAVFGAVSSFASFWTRGEISRERVPVGFACGLVGAVLGAVVLLSVPAKPLKPIVVVLLLGAAIFVALPRKPGAGIKPWAGAALAPLAVALGFYDGFFGPGTGSILIVLFAYVFGDSLTRASGNAKIVNLASNVGALALFALRGKVLWSIALPMAAANAAGAFVGARLAIRRGDRLVRAVVLAVVATIVVKLAVEMFVGA